MLATFALIPNMMPTASMALGDANLFRTTTKLMMLESEPMALSDTGTVSFTEQELSLIGSELAQLRSENDQLRFHVEGTAFSDDDLALIEAELASLASDKKKLNLIVEDLLKQKQALEGKVLAKESEMKRALEAKPDGQLQARVEDLEVQLKRLQSDKSILFMSSRRHFDRFKSTISELETELSAVRLELDTTKATLSITEESYRKVQGDKSTLFQSSRRHFDRFRSAVAELQTELAAARFELDTTKATLSITEESYEKFRGRSPLSLLVYGAGRELRGINKQIKDKTGRAASKLGDIRRRMWLSSTIGNANASFGGHSQPRSEATRSLVPSR